MQEAVPAQILYDLIYSCFVRASETWEQFVAFHRSRNYSTEVPPEWDSRYGHVLDTPFSGNSHQNLVGRNNLKYGAP